MTSVMGVSFVVQSGGYVCVVQSGGYVCGLADVMTLVMRVSFVVQAGDFTRTSLKLSFWYTVLKPDLIVSGFSHVLQYSTAWSHVRWDFTTGKYHTPPAESPPYAQLKVRKLVGGKHVGF